MSYQAEISRRSPTAFVILVDQSGSMADPFGLDSSFTKSQFVADVVNKWLQNLVLRCAKGEVIRNYFEVAVVGYGAEVRSLLEVGSSNLTPIADIATSPQRIEDRKQKVDDGAGGIVEMNVKFPIWVDPMASGPTPMGEALSLAERVLRDWANAHPQAYPPTVINITDGEATDPGPQDAAERLKEIATTDGNVLVFNCHISGHGGYPVLYPADPAKLPDAFAEMLFDMSSVLPSSIAAVAGREGFVIEDGARGFAYQADAGSFVRFVDIGTRTSNLPMRME